jgi:5-methylcytosine-specific restriction endonuclease McrA
MSVYYQKNGVTIRDRVRSHRKENLTNVREQDRAKRQRRVAYWATHNPYLDHPTGLKECRHRHGPLPVSRFSRHSNMADGLNPSCRECAHTTGETKADRAAWTAIARTRPPCAYCGDASEHIDHVVPLSKGGRDIASNYLPACSFCNTSKGAKWVFDFLFGTEGLPDTEKPAAYQSWDAPFLTELFAELERPDDARP